MNDNQILGLNGEIMAQQYLKKQKYKLLEKNYRCPMGELDIISKDKDTIVFIEVKTRTSQKYGLPCEAVNFTKRQKIEKSAKYYLNLHNMNNCNARFDVIEILDNKINHIINAWETL